MRKLLRKMYGRPVMRLHGAPLEELVLTVLSQNTNDTNRDAGYTQLRERLPSWKDVQRASPADLEDAIRPAGIAKMKAAKIKEILDRIEEEAGRGRNREKRSKPAKLSLDWLESLPNIKAREFLLSLPGVGRKTAACVLLFSYGSHEVPVDTHVYRTGARLGLICPGSQPEEAHDSMLAATAPRDAYETHMNMIRHGRRLCRPAPDCQPCNLKRMCTYWRDKHGQIVPEG